MFTDSSHYSTATYYDDREQANVNDTELLPTFNIKTIYLVTWKYNGTIVFLECIDVLVCSGLFWSVKFYIVLSIKKCLSTNEGREIRPTYHNVPCVICTLIFAQILHNFYITMYNTHSNFLASTSPCGAIWTAKVHIMHWHRKKEVRISCKNNFGQSMISFK